MRGHPPMHRLGRSHPRLSRSTTTAGRARWAASRLAARQQRVHSGARLRRALCSRPCAVDVGVSITMLRVVKKWTRPLIATRSPPIAHSSCTADSPSSRSEAPGAAKPPAKRICHTFYVQIVNSTMQARCSAFTSRPLRSQSAGFRQPAAAFRCAGATRTLRRDLRVRAEGDADEANIAEVRSLSCG